MSATMQDHRVTVLDWVDAATRQMEWHNSPEGSGTVGLRCALDALAKAFCAARKAKDRDAMSRICAARNKLRAQVYQIEPWRKTIKGGM